MYAAKRKTSASESHPAHRTRDGLITDATLSREVEGPGVGLHPVGDLDGVMTLLFVRGVADLHPGHLRRAADPHLLRGGDLALPAEMCTDKILVWIQAGC